MCGIGAILDPAGTSGQHAAERMVEALRHRGPDGEALRRIGPVALAHTRLAIIDVAGGDQPLDSEDGRGHRDRQRRDLQPPRPARGARAARPPVGDELGQRGRRARLRGAWRGLRPSAQRDLRVRDLGRPRAAARRRPGRVRGEAAVLVDGRPPRGAGLGDRRADRRGARRRRRVDRVALDHYLACRFVPSPRTLFEGVRKLPAASTLVVERRRLAARHELARGSG